MGAFKQNLKKANEHLKTSKEESKKANEQMEEINRKLADKNAINKLHVERVSKLEQENIKLKKEGKKLQTKLK